MKNKLKLLIFFLMVVVLSSDGCGTGRQQEDKVISFGKEAALHSYTDPYQQMRYDMVRTQIERRGIRNSRVLEAMRTVPRHKFVPETMAAESYEDHPLPIGKGQTISQPYIVALMTDLLDLEPANKVLEIGTGSGYQAAVLGQLVDQVYTIEIIRKLADKASETIRELGYDNIHVRVGDGYYGWEEEAPFDAIILTAAPDEVPAPLLDQLAEGGRLVVPEGTMTQTLVIYEKKNGKIDRNNSIPVRFVPMTGKSEDN